MRRTVKPPGRGHRREQEGRGKDTVCQEIERESMDTRDPLFSKGKGWAPRVECSETTSGTSEARFETGTVKKVSRKRRRTF